MNHYYLIIGNKVENFNHYTYWLNPNNEYDNNSLKSIMAINDKLKLDIYINVDLLLKDNPDKFNIVQIGSIYPTPWRSHHIDPDFSKYTKDKDETTLIIENENGEINTATSYKFYEVVEFFKNKVIEEIENEKR